MKFLRRKDTPAPETDDTGPADEESAGKGQTPKKGRPTPSRRAAEGRRRGPVPPPPKTTREAIKRSKQLRKEGKSKLSKDERKKIQAERRERMMAGDERYLLPRDRGPAKAFVRDLVDSRRNIQGLFMPLAIVIFMTLLVRNPIVQQWATLLAMVMIAGMIVEAVANGRRITRLVRHHFPDETVKGRSIGWYAFIRASQIRKLRVPKPRVNPGDLVQAPKSS